MDNIQQSWDFLYFVDDDPPGRIRSRVNLLTQKLWARCITIFFLREQQINPHNILPRKVMPQKGRLTRSPRAKEKEAALPTRL